MADETKACPYCRKKINVQALVCRFCKMDVSTGERRVAPIALGERNTVVFTDGNDDVTIYVGVVFDAGQFFRRIPLIGDLIDEKTKPPSP